MNINVETSNVSEVCIIKSKETTKEEDWNTTSPNESKRESNKDSIFPEAQCAPNIVNRSIGMHLFEVLGYKLMKPIDILLSP